MDLNSWGDLTQAFPEDELRVEVGRSKGGASSP